MAETLIAGRYRLDTLLGKGGMSEVWRATDIELDRRVALKLLAPKADVERFEREARAFAALAHPNVTQLYDYGEDGDRPYMVLEYVPGGTLEDRLKKGPLPDAETRAIATDIASGLAHAHARAVVHRDLKPANILFDEEGRAKLADFGIAQTAGDGTLTDEGTVLGTAAYISPEQARGNPATPASDVYSFGVILFRMLTGRPPFESADPLELVALHRDADAPAIETVRADAPPALSALTAAALAKDPHRRPHDGAALLAALDGEAATDVTRVLAPPPPPRAERRRSPALAILLLLVLALAGAGLAYAITRPSGAASTPPPTTAPSKPFTLSTASTSTPSTSTSTSTSTSLPTTTQPATTIQATTVHTTTAPAPPPTTTAPPPPPTTTAPTTTAPTTTGP
ncbi:MAG TPA: serine/threonine-protein kinase [Gaiellaceae bacterium]|nr:serine/threonine-protein kinase [Gaiellaceae bacterium]